MPRAAPLPLPRLQGLAHRRGRRYPARRLSDEETCFQMVLQDPALVSSAEALFRYTAVSQVRSLELAGQPSTEAVRMVCQRLHYQFNGVARRISERTVYRWLSAYEQHGVAGLEPTPRPRTDSSVVLSVELLSFVVDQRRDDPDASIPELIKRAHELGKIPSKTSVVRQTLYRALRRMGISTGRRKKRRDRDTRKFAYPHRLDMVLADGKHFRAGAQRLRRVALFFLDDATRYGLHVVVGTSESTELFLRGLYELSRKYGIASIYYLDHGPGFIAADTASVIARMNRSLIHGEKVYPEGHGKIERFNQTAKAALLRHLDRRPDVDPECRALELRLQHYLHEVYNREPHEGLEGATPFQRFHGDAKLLCLPENDESLRRLFLVSLSRRVAADHTIPIGSTDYEVPRGYAGHRITVHRHALEGRILFLHDGRFIELVPVDPVANARARRGRRRDHLDEDVVGPLPKSAAELAFDRDFSPIVDPDGGFSDPDKE